MGVGPRMLSFALTFLLLLLHHNPANSESEPEIIPFSCKRAERWIGNLKQTREQALLKHKSAQWRAYQMKYKSQEMEKRQASLKNSLKECINGGGNGSSEFVCEFSPECKFHPLYHGLNTDGELVCIHGKCEEMSDVMGEMCTKYTECDCRSNPEKCFCIMGQCENRAWECHEHRDCDRMKKCKGKRCVCRGATCEISWKVPLNSGQGDVKHGEYYNNNDEDVNGDGEKAREPGRSV